MHPPVGHWSNFSGHIGKCEYRKCQSQLFRGYPNSHAAQQTTDQLHD